MVFRLALRNVLRNLPRLRPVLIIFGASFLLLTVVNAVLDYTDRSFSEAYVDHVTSDAVITEQTENSFTLFGTDTVLVGEYLEPPVIRDPDSLSASLDEHPLVADYEYVVTTPARIEFGSERVRQMAFGVSFETYPDFFDDFELVAGSWPLPGEAATVIQEHVYERLFDTGDYEAHLGASVIVAAAARGSFAIREVSLAGVYSYPVRDQLLETVMLVDAGTARALAGYLRGGAATAVPDEQSGMFGEDLDSLFGDPDADLDADDARGEGNLVDDIDDLFARPLEDPPRATQADESGAWNFALVESAPGVSESRLIAGLRDSLDQTPPYAVLDWRRSIGGNALIVSYVRLLANIGLLCVAAAAIIMTANALMLSVLERTKEIGTMRAIGAQRLTVTELLALETLFTVLGAAAVGIVLGIAVVVVLNGWGVAVTNQYLAILFGGSNVAGSISLSLVLRHLGMGAVLALVALVYPLLRLLKLAPIDALNA